MISRGIGGPAVPSLTTPHPGEEFDRRWIRSTTGSQLRVLIRASRGEYGRDGGRITDLFGFVGATLHNQIESGELPKDLPIAEMLRQAAARTYELWAAVRPLLSHPRRIPCGS